MPLELLDEGKSIHVPVTCLSRTCTLTAGRGDMLVYSSGHLEPIEGQSKLLEKLGALRTCLERLEKTEICVPAWNRTSVPRLSSSWLRQHSH
jgi:hypothetical protein